LIVELDNLPRNAHGKHLLWTLLHLKTYVTESILSTLCACDEKTFCHWSNINRDQLALSLDRKVIWDNRYINMDLGQICLTTVDGTDFRIMEPTPFDPANFSHKFKGPGVRYEIAVCVKTGWIVWVNGPFPCGRYSDVDIARISLHYMLETWEQYIADSVYRSAYDNFARTPTGLWDFADIAESDARARHECINRRLNEFRCLHDKYRHDRKDHFSWFAPCALMVQLEIERGTQTFDVEYIEDEFGIARM